MNQSVHPLKTGCRHFRSDRPCAPHKVRGKTCPTCDEYDPTANRMLVIKLAAMGDVLRTTSLLRGLKTKFDAPVVWVTQAESVELLRHNPFIQEIWTSDDRLAARLDSEPFKAVINVDADRSSAAICAMARAAEKHGFSLDERGNVLPLSEPARKWFFLGINDELKRQNRQTYQQIIAEIAGLPADDDELVFSLTDEEKAAAAEFAAQVLPRDRGAVVGFNTGGADRWQRKQWTFDGFAGLGQRILRETKHCLVLYGGAREEEFNRRLEKALGNPRVININTQRSVRDFAAMLSVCDVLVTGDTLGLHLAAALGKQIVAIFGPTSAAEIELYGRGTKIVPEMRCKSFYRPVCEASPCCVETVSADRVFDAVETAVRLARSDQ